jgi:acetoin utilization deacetylase AcuC-like enzyme
MKVVFHKDFLEVYTTDPASASGRLEAVLEAIETKVDFVTAQPADLNDLTAVHSAGHIQNVRNYGLYDISALAAGGTIQAAEIGLTEPCFALVRPPGHHSSFDQSWGFCYFNNMAAAIEALKRKKRIKNAYVLDIDLHYGDGTVNILGEKDYAKVYNIDSYDRLLYLDEVAREMEQCNADIIGISAGFDNHVDDWGGLLLTEDYFEIGKMVRKAARRAKSGCFAVLEGGYNHKVLGHNALALIEGMADSD